MKRKKPRDYQKDIIEQVVKSNKSTLIQIPTGGGKTFIAYEIATDLIAKFDQQVLFVAPRENLVYQTAEEFKFARPHIVHSSNKEDKNIKTYDFKTYPLLISTLQTAYRRDNINPDVVIIDETHFGFDGKMINTLIQSNKQSRIIGLSATPYDKFGRQLQGFDLILDKYDMRYMIDNKYLVPLKSYKRQKIKGLDKIKITQGDYDIGELEQVVCNNHTIMEIAETTKDKIAESEKTIVFAVTIKHADLLAEAYKNAGFTARALHSKSEESDAETIDYFKKGYIKVLVSVSKLTMGFDVPSADCAVIARPTKSQNLYKQMVGRVLRLSAETNKTYAVLLDCGNVIDTLGDPLAPIKLSQPKESDNTLKCNQCKSENLKLKKIKGKSYWKCQECGYLKKIKEGTYKCAHCNKYSNKKSKFIFTDNKIMLDCSFCGTQTTISEFLGDETLVSVNDIDNNINSFLEDSEVSNNDYDEHGFDKDGIHQDTAYLTDKYGHRRDYYTSENKPSVQINHYDEYGFDDDGIHKDTGYLTDKYGHHKEYYTNKTKSSIQIKHYDEYGFDKDGIHQDTAYLTDKYGHRRDYYTSENKPSVQINHYDEYGFDDDGIHKDTGYLTDKYGHHKEYYTNKNKSSLNIYNFTGNNITFLLSTYEKISTYMRQNDYNKISKYISILMKKNDADFNTIWFQLSVTTDKDNQPIFQEHPVEFLLPKADKTKDFTSIKYILENNEELKYSILKKAVKNDLIHLEKYLMENYKFTIEDLFYELTYDKSMDCSYDLIESKMLNNFFKKYAYLWTNFDAYRQAAYYSDEENELEKTLIGLDYFFKQCHIDVLVNGTENPYKFLPFREAKEFVQKLQLKSINEWIDYISNKLPEYNPKPNEVPDDPQLIYKREWKGIEDWLGIKGDIKSFLQNLEFTSNYFDGYRQKLPSYKYKISKKQLKKYSTISNTITDERIHKMITNLDFKNFSTEIIGQFLDADNMYSKYHKNLLANPTISFETKLNFILINEKNNGKKILEFIHYLDINVSEIPQVEKIINTFEQTQDTLQYTPNIKDIKRSNIIIMKLKIKLQYLIYKKTGKPAVVSK